MACPGAHEARCEIRGAGDVTSVSPPGPFDPVRFCALTTVALLAWLVTPPVVITVTAGLGLWAYMRARRHGLTRSRCLLGDTRLVIGYLALAFLLGGALTVRGLLRVSSLH